MNHLYFLIHNAVTISHTCNTQYLLYIPLPYNTRPTSLSESTLGSLCIYLRSPCIIYFFVPFVFLLVLRELSCLLSSPFFSLFSSPLLLVTVLLRDLCWCCCLFSSFRISCSAFPSSKSKSRSSVGFTKPILQMNHNDNITRESGEESNTANKYSDLEEHRQY